MSRQDANAAFARTSFLYGGNADYLENLYARYETDPTSIDAQWQEFFQSLKDERADVMMNARGPSWRRPYQLARSELTSALDGDWRGTERALGDQVKARAPAARRRRLGPRGPAGDARFDPRADADPRLPRARSLLRQSRPARSRAAP